MYQDKTVAGPVWEGRSPGCRGWLIFRGVWGLEVRSCARVMLLRVARHQVGGQDVARTATAVSESRLRTLAVTRLMPSAAYPCEPGEMR